MTKIVDLSGTNEELVSRFVKFAHIHGALNTPEEANRAFMDSVAIWGELHRRGKHAVDMFLELLSADDPQIRLAAASKALFVSSQIAESVLEQLTAEPGFLGITAKMTLREWRAGKLKPLI